MTHHILNLIVDITVCPSSNKSYVSSLPPHPLGSDMDFRQLITSLRTTLQTLDLSQNIFPSTHLDALCAAFERGRLAGDSGPPLSDLNLATTNVEESHVRRLLASCDNLSSINLSGSRALPRDMKKLYQGDAFVELKSQLM